MKNKKIIIILILIIVAQVVLKIAVDCKKEDFFVDEMYSYGLMHYKQAFIFEEENFQENWHNKEYLDDYIVINENEKWDFTRPYYNQMEDFHPPVYYFLLRIATAFNIGNFNPWTGLILNIIIFILCDIVLYLIGKKLFKNKWYSLLLVFAYGFSKFSAENTLFIRMYQLLELEMLLLINWSLSNCYKKELDVKNMIMFASIVLLGNMTHYYFVIFMLPIHILNIIRYIRRKQFKNLIKYVGIIIAIEVFITIIFPAYGGQLVGNSDRTRKTGSLKVWTIRLINRSKMYFEIIDNNMFHLKVSYLIKGILAIGIVTAVIELIRNYKKKIRISRKINTIIIPTAFYLFFIIATSPYIDIRYILPMFVFILIIIMYFLKKELEVILKNKKIALIITSIICIIYPLMLWKNENMEYQYTGNKEIMELIQTHEDIPCIYMYEHATVLKNRFMEDYNYVRQFEQVYIMEKTKFSIEHLKEVIKQVDTTKGIMIIADEMEMYKKIDEIVAGIDEVNQYKIVLRIEGKGSIKNIYLLHPSENIYDL